MAWIAQRGWLGASCILAALLALGSNGEAAAQTPDLLDAATADDIASIPTVERVRSFRTRLVRVDEAALGALGAGAHQPSTGPASVGLAVSLFPNLARTFRRVSSELYEDGAFSWSGEVPDTLDEVHLVVSGSAVTGQAQIGGRVYRIEHVSGRVHRVSELDPRGRRPDRIMTPPRRAQQRGAAVAPPSTPEMVGGNYVVTILAAYTPAAKKASSNIVSDARLAVQLTNSAYRSSGVRVLMKLVHVMPVAYSEGGMSVADFERNLNDLTSGSVLAVVRQRRDAVRADLAVLIRHEGAVCGLGWMPIPDGQSSPWGYSVMADGGCIEYRTLAHETGHNMGLNHDRYVLSKHGERFPVEQYNFGYVNIKGRILDIMAYFDACEDRGVTCNWVNYFSTPRQRVNGAQIGVAAGSPGAADAARRLNETAPFVSAYR